MRLRSSAVSSFLMKSLASAEISCHALASEKETDERRMRACAIGKRVGAMRSEGKQSGAIRSNQEQSGAIGSNHEQSGAMRSNHEQSGAIMSNHEQS